MARSALGLFRAQFAAGGKPLEEVFAAVEAGAPQIVYSQDPGHRLRGARFSVDRSQGDGVWHLLSVGRDMYVAMTDAVYDKPRLETVAGEGKFEFYVKLSGKLSIELPCGNRLAVEGPTCLVLRAEQGCTFREQLEPLAREICVSVHCRPEFLRGLLADMRPAIAEAAWGTLARLTGPISHVQLPVTPGMVACVRGMLAWKHEGRLGLLYKEAKTLELVSLVVDALCGKHETEAGVAREKSDPRIDRARNILQGSIAEIPNVACIARTVGVCESKLKRDFKAHFGKTMFEYSLERRMLVALDMLRAGNLPVRAVAEAVGYRHHTSFTAAFRRFYGFLPKAAAREAGR
jgi:AraC-like DNA-binding protein